MKSQVASVGCSNHETALYFLSLVYSAFFFRVFWSLYCIDARNVHLYKRLSEPVSKACITFYQEQPII